MGITLKYISQIKTCKILTISNYQGNASENHQDISPHSSETSIIKKTKEKSWWGKGNPDPLLVGM
jgi:hypothetical protein